MRRAVTAIYRSHEVAALVRAELLQLGIPSQHIHVILGSERSTPVAPDGSNQVGGVAAPPIHTAPVSPDEAPPASDVVLPPGYDVMAAVQLYSDDGTIHGDAFDDLRHLHLPEPDAQIYQQAIRNGDCVVSVELDDAADFGVIERLMRRPEANRDLKVHKP